MVEDIFAHLAAVVAAATGRACAAGNVDGEEPPFNVLYAAQPDSGPWRPVGGPSAASTMSFQVVGVGRHWRDSLWALDLAVTAILAAGPPAGYTDMLAVESGSPTRLASDGLVAYGSHVLVAVTR